MLMWCDPDRRARGADLGTSGQPRQAACDGASGQRAEARKVIERLRQGYSSARPHGELAGLTPEEYRRAEKVENQ